MDENIVSVVTALIATTPQRWAGLINTLPPELLTRRPAPGQWSALECLQHVIDTEGVLHSRLQAFMDGRDFPAFDPDRQGTSPDAQEPAELVRRFAGLREASLAALAQIRPADLSRRVRHQELGPVTLGEMVHEWAAHDLNHLVQAERALMQPFIEGCGPWQPYFADHVVKA